MTRPLRIEYEDAYYHVMNRGRGRQTIFPSDEYYQAFLACLGEAHARFGLEAHGWCLMGNHYHLLVKTPRGNLGRAMRHIDGVYTQRHNRLKKTDGSLFRGRYKAIVIEANSYLLQVSRYIHRNPIELARPLVENLEDYPWSSYAAYINKATVPKYLVRESVYGELGSAQRYASYRRYVMQGNDEETSHFYSLKNTPAILGDKDFKAHAQSQSISFDGEVDKRGLKHIVPMADVLEAVSRYYNIPLKEIKIARRGRGLKSTPRRVAMKLCQELSGATLNEMAEIFHVGHYSTVSQTIRRLNIEITEDKSITNDLYMLCQDLTP
ncbi:hypothetical protein A9Q88_07350 [Gammaproteobacteria bacterium 50_400_T64]|mgnify:CR=1 FL=1|nr:hypothetical protein A9Q88_07350 [Gammaproteobacteria bacterium 50_400_T64]